MLNDIQKLINTAEARKKSHLEKFFQTDEPYNEGYHSGKEAECDFFIHRLTQILLAHQPKSEPSATIAANSMLCGPQAEPFCSCSFVMIMRGKDDMPYCAQCGLLVDDQNGA